MLLMHMDLFGSEMCIFPQFLHTYMCSNVKNILVLLIFIPVEILRIVSPLIEVNSF
jgi:hypothetical protein